MAVVGAGPAGLACAECLNRAGVEVTVYERGAAIGGLLASVVPGFKLDPAVLERRRGLLEASGIRFRLHTLVDAERVSGLLEHNDALFLGLGAQQSRRVDLPGLELQGVEQALSWLAAVNGGPGENLVGTSVLVLGGGDTAMDCARSALRLGARVRVAYRGPETRLRAAAKEVALAREEGVEILFGHVPEALLGLDRLESVRFAGGTVLRADLAVLAFGQQPDPPRWLDGLGVGLEPDGRIQVDDNGRTEHHRIYAGGDNTHGPDLAVIAMAAGRRAAEGILANTSRRLPFAGRAFAGGPYPPSSRSTIRDRWTQPAQRKIVRAGR